MNFLQDIDAIIFDFDGTLYDNHGQAKLFIKRKFFEILKVGNERKLHKQMKGVYLETYDQFHKEYISKLTAACGKKITQKNMKKISEWYKKSFLAELILILKEKYSARKEVNDFFAFLNKAGKKIAVLSDYEVVHERMEALNISSEKVDFISSAQELGGLKPAPQIFLKVSKELNVNPEKILVVGDRDDTDGKGARLSGMKFVQIHTIKNTKKNAPENHPFVSWEDFVRGCGYTFSD